MDKKRYSEIESTARSCIGETLRHIRQDNNKTLAQAAELTGGTPEHLARIEDDEKPLNLVRFLQHVATLCDSVVVVSSTGAQYPIATEPFREKQINERQRADSIRYEKARRWANGSFSANQRTTQAPFSTKDKGFA